MSERPGPGPGRVRLFLERETYQRHRRADSARLLPVLGAGVLLLPDLLLSDPTIAFGATATWLVYFFLAWAGLIALTYVLSRRLRADLDHGADDQAAVAGPQVQGTTGRADGR